MNQKKRLAVQLLVLLLTIALCSGLMWSSVAAMQETDSINAAASYTITLKYFFEEDNAPQYVEMVVGVNANTSILNAIQSELGANWMDIYRDEYHQQGQLDGSIDNDLVTGDVVIIITYPLIAISATFTSSAVR